LKYGIAIPSKDSRKPRISCDIPSSNDGWPAVRAPFTDISFTTHQFSIPKKTNIGYIIFTGICFQATAWLVFLVEVDV